MRSKSPHRSIPGLAAACAVLLGLSGCAASDDGDDGIGKPGAMVEGLVPSAATAPPVAPPVVMARSASPSLSLHLAAFVAPAPAPSPTLAPSGTDRAAAEIAAAMAAAVPDTVHLPPERQAALIALGQQMAAADHLFIRQPQLVLIVDGRRGRSCWR